MSEQLIAKWVSRSSKHSVSLYFNPAFHLANGQVVPDAHYIGDRCGGGITASTADEAIIKMQARVDSGYFQPDANKTPMRRVL